MTSDSILVVKLGGGEGLNLAAACDDLAGIARRRPLVVVHGVSAAVNQICADLGVEAQTLISPSGHSSRYTPAAVRDIFVRASESANEGLVSALRQRGVAAEGLVGANVVVEGRRKQAIRAVFNGRIRVVRDDYSGSIQRVNALPLNNLLERTQAPVLPPMAMSPDGLLNIDGDRAGAAVACALKADTLLILSNVKGLYRHFPDETSLVSQVLPAQMDSAMQWAQGRMKRKVLAVKEALHGGIRRVIIGDGRGANPVSQALSGSGTRFIT